jgi:2-polyprenyl-3-methyl-5-hydroxy-6-metoxy-1,4-benzoquinol methylase
VTKLWLTDDEARQANELPWWQLVQLSPKIWSNSDHRVTAEARLTTAGISFDGARVLDLGTNDCACPLVALRRGAKSVHAIDMADLPFFDFLREHGIEFDYTKLNLDTLNWQMLVKPAPYDVIVCHGLLYHTNNIPGIFKGMKALLADGGLIAIETRIVNDPTMHPAGIQYRHPVRDTGLKWHIHASAVVRFGLSFGLGARRIPQDLPKKQPKICRAHFQAWHKEDETEGARWRLVSP